MSKPRVRVFDNGGTTLDRYTVILEGGGQWEVRTASHHANEPAGVWQHMAGGDGLTPRRYREGTPVALDAAPDGLRRAIAAYLAEEGDGD